MKLFRMVQIIIVAVVALTALATDQVIAGGFDEFDYNVGETISLRNRNLLGKLTQTVRI